MIFRRIDEPKLAQVSYLIGCQQTGEAIVIDPARDVDRYLDVAAEEGLRLVAAAETHIHADFLSGARQLATRHGARAYLSAEGGEDWSYRWPEGDDVVLVRDGERIEIGRVTLEVWHTPGHTPEHVSYLLRETETGDPIGLFSGDFVFVGDVGRPDLLETAAGIAGTSETAARALARSAARFLDLPDFVQVWPAHGAGSACGKALGAMPQSTVGYERRHNPALAVASDVERFVRYALEDQPEPPLYFARMKRDNRDGPALLDALPAPRELAAEELAAWSDGSGVVLDTRGWDDFARRHLAGSLFAPLDRSFPTVAGSYVREDESIALVVARDRIEEAVRDLVRVGLDRVTGFATPAAIEAVPDARTAATRRISTEEMSDWLARGAVPIDVRRRSEFRRGHLAGAINVPHTRLAARLDEIPADATLIVHCALGGRAAVAGALLERAGRDVVVVDRGGAVRWQQLGRPLVTEE